MSPSVDLVQFHANKISSPAYYFVFCCCWSFSVHRILCVCQIFLLCFCPLFFRVILIQFSLKLVVFEWSNHFRGSSTSPGDRWWTYLGTMRSETLRSETMSYLTQLERTCLDRDTTVVICVCIGIVGVATHKGSPSFEYELDNWFRRSNLSIVKPLVAAALIISIPWW